MSTAKSVGTWTWRNITPAGLQALIERTHTPERQAERGKKATNQAQIAALGGVASGQVRTPEAQAERGRKATNQAQIASLGGIASGEARRLSREQERATARLLRARGYTQQQIADEIGVPQRTISRWLS
jgi:DNA-binding NarL/FixJ family response regulator